MDRSFFSISFDLILRGSELPYDLYVNSSSLEKKQKFIKVFPKKEVLEDNDLLEMKDKYKQLYVAEDERDLYVKSLIKNENASDIEVASLIKDSAISYLHQIFDPKKDFNTVILEETISGCKDAVENMIDVLDDYSIDGLSKLIASLSAHDFYTYDHSINVSMYCISLLRALKPDVSRVELMHAGLGGLLHDLGKIKIPTNILNSPGGLTEEQYQVIKTHPDIGFSLLDEIGIEVEGVDLKTISRVVHEHHEQWDGKGYPRGLKEKEIHLLARVCTIADFFDAITTKRSYSQVLTISQGIAIMDKNVGTKLDPTLFKIFKNYIKHSNVESTKDMRMADHFDPTIPYAELPLEEIDKLFTDDDFGKIKLIEDSDKPKKKKK